MIEYLGPAYSYVCPKCDQRLGDVYMPFCARCGSKLPSEKRMQAIGLVDHHYLYSNPIKSLSEINELLSSLGIREYHLRDYFSSHQTLNIEIPSKNYSNWYTITCTQTIRIESPIAWTGTLFLEQTCGKQIRLTDEKNEIEIVAGVALLFNNIRQNWG